ncbi:helix-turn-helix transcriptional regulator [Ktedonobacter robiniae]|uniref:Transcriptional regulator n=1 Tax=Ktedonobacter robiniae TaxID=2778365 RepID=A0ABQ3UVJ9_9CHLR|nr:WYL domain-containing protein [Ktedonobacter robiniae]GHO56831.1 transcriptional regulator [Ktedonobacter robiniae]
MRADRLLTILLLLQARGRMTAQELAERLEVSVRTMYRDLQALSQAGIPIYADAGTGGGYALVEQYQTRLTGFTKSEVRALAPSQSGGPLHDLGLGSALEAAFLKLEVVLSPHWQGDIDTVKRSIHLDSTGWLWAHEPVPFLPLLNEALWLGQKVEVDYSRHDGQIRQRIIDPYGLVAKSTIWYLIGAVDGQIRIFRVSRVREARRLSESSQRPREFDVRVYWETWKHTLEAKYTPYVVRLRLAPEGIQKLFERVDETVRTSMREEPIDDDQGWHLISMTFHSLLHAQAVVLGMGNLLEVLEPLELREAIRAQAQQIVALYE